ncbi:hypothetical protein L7F22_051163 [Adiantum nelumboides]|nr:hypothetical protein [Adiantum nelumboides]
MKEDCYAWKCDNGKGKGTDKDNDAKEEKSKSSVKIEELNIVQDDCDARDINMLTKNNDVFYDAQETLSLQSSMSAELLVSGEVSHTWILDSGASLHVTPHRHWFTTYEETIGTVTLGGSYSCDIVGIGDIAMIMENGKVQRKDPYLNVGLHYLEQAVLAEVSSPMDEEQFDKAVLAYLQKKKYHHAEQALQEELLKSASSSSKADPDIANQVLRYAKLDNAPALYKEAYSKLRSWVHSSLDIYKHELLRILYPVFLHCFMDLVSKGFSQEARSFFQSFRDDYETLHSHDLQRLEAVLSSDHLQEMELARSLRENKVNVKMCQFSFDLLLQYLHNTDSSLMLGIVNEHINLQVSAGQPTSWSDEDLGPLLGKSQEGVSEVNAKEIKWGMLEDSLEEKAEKELAGEAEKVEAEGKEAEGEEAKKKTGEAGKMKRLKKDKTTGTTGKSLKTETTSVSVVPRVKSELVLPAFTEESERRALEDLRNRARLSSSDLPSVSFYTFLNTHSSLNCASIASDGAMVVGGFADSSVKVWDMAKLGEQQSTSGNETSITNKSIEVNEGAADIGKPPYTLLKGHAGPIYSASFSPDGDYILSASNDCTVRLWSLPLVANLVLYKGHNYPVWDVQVSL